MSYVASNRLVYEAWEDREYNTHLRRLDDAKKKHRIDNTEPLKFPHIANKAKSNQIRIDRSYDIDVENRALGNKIDKIRFGNGVINNWNFDYEKHNMKFLLRDKDLGKLEKENLKMAKRIENSKGAYSIKKWETQFAEHERIKGLRKQKFYTPRGVGYRNAVSLPTSKRSLNTSSRAKDNLISLYEAVNQFERADMVLLKTLVLCDYKECLRIKSQYEEKYSTDLRKGLLKVLDKEYEPFVNAFLIDNNEVDAERIYESLYAPSEAAVVLTEAILLRNGEEKDELLKTFESKLDSQLDKEISSKIDGDLKRILLALVQNSNLNLNMGINAKAIEANVKTLTANTDSMVDAFVKILEKSTKEQLKAIFEQFQLQTDSDLHQKVSANKAILKAVRTMQSCVIDPDLYIAVKLQRYMKMNKQEFIRLFVWFSQEKLESIMQAYSYEFDVNMEVDIKNSFKENLLKYFLKRLPKHDMNRKRNSGL